MFKRLAYALTGLVLTGTVALATTLPLVPSNPTYSEPSQIIGTLNALIQQLNGQQGYAPATGIVSLGASCTGAAGASPVTCNGQRGVANFTGITVTTTGSVQTLTITNSAVTAASVCSAWFVSAFTAGSAVDTATVVASAGSLAVVAGNGGTTSNAVTTGALAFNCFN